MNLCSSTHDEICFDGHACPLCATKEDLNRQISDLTDERDSLQRQLDEIESWFVPIRRK
jgi:hypothetical protein